MSDLTNSINYKEVILNQMKKFTETLGSEFEAAMELSSFGKSFFVKVTDIEQEGELITIRGLSGGKKPISLIQHVSRLRVLFLPVKKGYWDK